MNASQWIDRLAAVTSDFPQPGVVFRDLTPVLAHGPAFAEIVAALSAPFPEIDAVAGVDARGFLLAGGVAAAREVGVIAVRKAGKLPPPTLREEYALEYGAAALEVRADLIPAGSRVLIIDDVLATGGTLAATVSLIERAGGTVAGVAVALEILGLSGRSRLLEVTVHALRTV